MSQSAVPSFAQDAYSKRFVSVAGISRVAVIGDQKFEVITHNRTFTFRAENDGTEGWGCTTRRDLGIVGGVRVKGTEGRQFG